jgi:hypothetical protein
VSLATFGDSAEGNGYYDVDDDGDVFDGNDNDVDENGIGGDVPAIEEVVASRDFQVAVLLWCVEIA